MPKLLANQPEIIFFQRDCPKPIIVAGFRSLDFHPEVHLALADFHVVYACHFAAENWTGNVCGEGDTFANSAPLRTKFQGVLPRGGLNILKSCKDVSFLAAKRMVWTQRKKRQNGDHQLMPKGPSRRWSEKNPTQMMLQQLASRSLEFDGFCNFDRPLKPQNTSRLAHRSASCMMAVNLSSCRSTIRESCWGESDNGGEMEDTTMAISMTKLMIQTNWTSGKWW